MSMGMPPKKKSSVVCEYCDAGLEDAKTKCKVVTRSLFGGHSWIRKSNE